MLRYIPILKGRAGELEALRVLGDDVKAKLTPLIEIPPIPFDFVNDRPARRMDAHLAAMPGKLLKSWGDQEELLIDADFVSIHQPTSNQKHPMAFLLESMRALNMKVIPVTGTGRDAEYQESVKSAVHADGRGVCIRLENDDFEDPTGLTVQLDQLLQFLQEDKDQVDLVLDFKEVSRRQTGLLLISAANLISSLPDVQKWRTLTLAASSFPQDLSGVGPDSEELIQRAGWAVWRALFQKGEKIRRLPRFGDYGVNHPEPVEIDPRIMRMSANLRYTLEEEWLVLKGRNVRDFGYDQFNGLCRVLSQRRDYSGPAFSWGDNYISLCAGDQIGPGNASIWRKIGTSHHLSFVVSQLSKIDAV